VAVVPWRRYEFNSYQGIFHWRYQPLMSRKPLKEPI